MKLKAYWTLLFYPNLKGQSGKNVWKILKKEQDKAWNNSKNFHKPN